MATGNDLDRLRGLYDIDWTSVGPRENGLAAAAEVMAPDVKAHISPEVGERVLDGLGGFATFVQGLEEDFSEFRYVAEEVTETAPGEYVVIGKIQARGRLSNMPLSSPFRHEWTFRDGSAHRVEAGMG